jgi:hypothetical protein
MNIYFCCNQYKHNLKPQICPKCGKKMQFKARYNQRRREQLRKQWESQNKQTFNQLNWQDGATTN